MICDARLKDVQRTSASVRYIYHCTLDSGSWSGDVIIESADLTMTENVFDTLKYASLATSISNQAIADTGVNVTVAEDEVRMA